MPFFVVFGPCQSFKAVFVTPDLRKFKHLLFATIERIEYKSKDLFYLFACLPTRKKESDICNNWSLDRFGKRGTVVETSWTFILFMLRAWKNDCYLLKERSLSHSLHQCCGNESRRPEKKKRQ